MPVLLVRYPGKSPIRYEMTTDAVTVGSDRKNDLPLADRSAAQRHCRIEMRGEAVYLTGLGSQTLLNGRDIGDDPVKLCNGDEITVGHTRITFDDPHSPKRPILDRITTRLFGFKKEKREELLPGFMKCRSCGTTIHIGARAPGSTVGCPRCKSMQKAP